MSDASGCPFMTDQEFDSIRCGPREQYDSLSPEKRDAFHKASKWHFANRCSDGGLSGITVGGKSVDEILGDDAQSSSN
jgi:hypothetical protein